MKKRALITGITGQDGSYLSELLLEKNYEVHGIVRRSSSNNLSRIEHVVEQLHLHPGDLTDGMSLKRIVREVQPHEVYNLAAMSHVKFSFDAPEHTMEVNGQGPLRLLEAIRQECRDARFYQASTSELFGGIQKTPQYETTPFYPRSPYATSKLFAFWSVVNYREAYKIFASNGILFNHESPRRGKDFVTRKISQGVARIHLGLQEEIVLGNLDAKRDWGYAKDYVEGMWRILQCQRAQDFVLATGKMRSVREFVESCFAAIHKQILWEGKSVDEIGKDLSTGRTLIRVSKEFFRPTEVDVLCGDATKAHTDLGWSPKTTFSELATMMVEEDLKLLKASLGATATIESI